jgi:hypothetical protein
VYSVGTSGSALELEETSLFLKKKIPFIHQSVGEMGSEPLPLAIGRMFYLEPSSGYATDY